MPDAGTDLDTAAVLLLPFTVVCVDRQMTGDYDKIAGDCNRKT